MSEARTSAATLHNILATGLITKQRANVLEALFEHGPCTARELQEKAFDGKDFAHKRLPELKAQGVAQEIGTRTCAVTGQSATLWDIAPGPAVKYEPPATASEQLASARVTMEAIARLSREVLEGRHQGVPVWQLREKGEELNKHLAAAGQPVIPPFCFAV